MLGIINPIEAKQRKGKGAVGAYGSERTSQSLQDFPVVDSEEEAEEVFMIPGTPAFPLVLFVQNSVLVSASVLKENCLKSF